MERLLLARHAESTLGAQGLANGDPAVPCPLTPAGRGQAAALAASLRDEPVDLCVVTGFERARQTAELALAGREVPTIVLPLLDEPRYGAFEGGPLAEYRAWAWATGPLERPPGGEHRGELAGRYAEALRALLARPEPSILVVAHSLPVRYTLDAAEGRPPAARVELVEHAVAHRLTAAQARRAAEVLGAWSLAPGF